MRENEKNMDYKLLDILINESSTAIYVADYETDKLLYLNQTAGRMLGVNICNGVGQKCYEFLMRRKTPCPFCHKSMLEVGGYKDGTITHPMNQHQYRIRSKVLQLDKQKVHVHYVTDETELLTEQKQLRTLTDRIPGGVGIYYVYADGRIESYYLNDGYYALIGSTRAKRAEFLGFSVLDAVHKNDAGALHQEVQRAIKENRQLRHELRVMKDDGTYLWGEIRADIVEHNKDRWTLYCCYSDIDELKRTQEELEHRYEDQVRYTRMLSTTSLASSMVNLTKNYITMQDTENPDIMTVITQQTPQQGFETMYPQIPDAQIRAEYEAVFDTDIIIRDFEKGIAHKSIVHPYKTMDYWMESSYDAVRNPRSGDLEVYCFAKDISEKLRQKKVSDFLMFHQYDDVILIQPDTGKPFSLVSSGKTEVYHEQEAAHDYNKGLEIYFQKYCADDDVASSADAASLKTVNEMLKTQEIYTISYSVYDQNHKIIRKRVSYSYLDKYHTSILCTIQDVTKDFENEVTQRELLQAALTEAHQAVKAKSDFLSNMSHDMRTPMNAIIGLSNLAMDLETVDEYQDYMMKINAAGQQLLSLINDTLDVSRIENGKLHMNREYVLCSHLLLEGISPAKVVAEQKGVHFELVREGVQENLLYVDSLKIIKIFNNLLSNAIKFTPAGGTVTFALKRLSESDHVVQYRLQVSDTGIGMSSEFIQHIFEPFSQERTDYETNASGTGLGMTIVKSMVDFLGGKIEIQSELNVGTTVTVWLPFQMALTVPEVPKSMKKTGIHNSYKILVAEDHPLNALIVEKLLQKKDYTTDIVKNGKECVSAFIRSAPAEYAAILMDIRMPVMDGLQATKAIRLCGKGDAAAIPIIAMTANAFEQDIKECLDAGMNAHLSKPIEPAKLYEVLEQLL